MKKLLLPATLLLSSGLAAVGTAHAGTATGTLNVSADIQNECTVTTTAVSFGVVSGATGATTTGSVDLTCSLGLIYFIALDAGANYDGLNRNISNGIGNLMSYELKDSVTGAPWGDDFTLGSTVLGMGTGLAVSHAVDATLFSAVGPTGTYTDTVNVTVTY